VTSNHMKSPMIKFTILLKRRPNLTQSQFVEYHKTVHAGLFTSLPVVKETLRRYVQQHAIDVMLPGAPPRKYDGITELWFDDVAALARCFSDAEYLARIRPDEESFLDLQACDFVVSTENVVTQ
jgi:uncharacterized protein (TIGR02118 family)